MTETRSFPTADVLSVLTDMMISERGIGAIYSVLNWMSGDELFTHQLPRVGQEAIPAILNHRPELATAIAEAAQVNPENWRHWLSVWVERYGSEIDVPKLTVDQHEQIDPMSELAERIHPDKIIVVNPGKRQ